ncbi:DNA mismatch repair protein MutL [Xylariomycetidae sp. FL2044]|nr:DNA mismatch repair protein MutL [Xylariomycetidae sp. FL2044]
MATIKAIESTTVHQIQSGQVIVDLCSVVKELVENGLDAGATNIEVRFKNQGLDSIEVQDNGSGITKENYETLALKHYTSKLTTYSDLSSLQTFGFRGEALSSLCALSKFTVTTCLAVDAPKGTRLEFETSGRLRSTSIVASQKGTTVSIEGLFHNLPVRRRELERNIKREWNKVIALLNQYACVQTDLKFSVSQQPTKGKRMVLFSTKGNQTTRENIINVFGARTLAVLIPLDLVLEFEPTAALGQRAVAQGDGSVKKVHVRGHVSRPAHGEGRQTPDRQMFYVNGRPCGLPQFAKVFNEVYKSYNASQSPFIFADIQLDTHLYDVNVSPDKRTILLHDQTRMLDNLRESLVALFESQDYALPLSQLSSSKQTPFKKLSINRQDTLGSENGLTRSTSIENGSRATSMSVNPEPDTPRAKDGVKDESQEAPNPMASVLPTSSSSHDTRRINLLSQWIGRKSDSRADIANVQQAPEGQNPEDPKFKGNMLSRFTMGESEETRTPPREIRSPTRSPFSIEPTNEAGQVEDSHSRVDKSKNVDVDESAEEPAGPSTLRTDPPIPALVAPSRVSEIKTYRTTPSSPIKRPAPEVATITIGDDTITSTISAHPKRQRIDIGRAQVTTKHKTSDKPQPTPSFNGRLTQMFAANSQSKGAMPTELEITTDDRDVSDESDGSSEDLFVRDESPGTPAEAAEAQPPIKVEENELSPPSSEAIDDDNGLQGPQVRRNGSLSEDDAGDDDYIDEDAPDGQTEAAPQDVLDSAEGIASEPSEEIQKRTQSFVKGGTKKKDATYQFRQTLRVKEEDLRVALRAQAERLGSTSSAAESTPATKKLDAEDAEEKLSLTISKSDFGNMKIVGQFNLGFILAVRPARLGDGDIESLDSRDDELFIIDQHATDEKYNFERLQASTVVQSQRLVQPKALELTALEEEVIKENLDALETNGFIVSIDDSGDQPVGSRCQLLSLPLSRETTFSLADLEELISLLTDHQSNSAVAVPRPSKVRKMFAMRACRSSVMIGKSLTSRQMERLVRHMGELDKPWNCPHGRPTMRHLGGLGSWNDVSWQEGDSFDRSRTTPTNWAAYLRETQEA